jgi:predicted phage tail protein
LKTIRLHGWLGKRFGKQFRLDVASPAEAVRALCSQLAGFQKALTDDVHGFRVRVQKTALVEKELQYPFGASETLHLVPAVSGSGGKGGIGQIFLGIALIAASFLFPPAFTLFGVAVAPALASFGFSMILGGVAQFLFAPPSSKVKERPENKPSYAFNGPVNTVQQGNCVPVLYGELIIGSQVVSAGLFTEDLAV